MAFSNIIAFFIILTTAAVLNAGGVTNIHSAAEAAEALRPLAGELTFVMFALGIVGTGLLAVPVLAGSAAYCVAEAFGWPATLEAKAPDAVGFYSIVAAATVVGLAATAAVDLVKKKIGGGPKLGPDAPRRSAPPRARAKRTKMVNALALSRLARHLAENCGPRYRRCIQ
jgi:hypothetical protein